MPRNFGSLTMGTFSCPFAYICPDVGPDDLGAYCLPRPFDPGMPKAVDRVEKFFSEGEWNVGSRRTVADVHNERAVPYANGLEVQARSGVIPKASELRI